LQQEKNYLVRNLSAFVALSDEEKACLLNLQSKSIKIERGRELPREEQQGTFSYILQSGWACSCRSVLNGDRQVIVFPLPGDWIGLHSIFLKTSDKTTTALTDITVARVQISALKKMFETFPSLETVILGMLAREEAQLVERMTGIGRRSALERTAYLLLELLDRLTIIGLAQDNNFD
jgi:CRP-like cAMP-binding protein